MSKFFDTHAHLGGIFYRSEIERDIASAKKAGVVKILLPGTNYEDSRLNLDLALKHPKHLYAAVGIHPADAFEMESFQKIARLFPCAATAIGETGLDLYHVKTNPPLARQQEIFEAHLKLARRYHLPVIVHARNAEAEVYEILRDYSDLTIIMHSFTGTLEAAQMFLNLPKVYISLSGPVTFAQAKNLHTIAATLPLERLVIETDAPFLTPEPYRGQPNSPANVVYVARVIARLRKEPESAVLEALYNNALRALGIND